MKFFCMKIILLFFFHVESARILISFGSTSVIIGNEVVSIKIHHLKLFVINYGVPNNVN
jgi:hypothetical protein